MPRLWFLCPRAAAPTGGVRTTYRFVAHLRSHGVEATVVHPGTEPAMTWMDEPADPVVSTTRLTVSDADVVVVPDVWAWRLTDQLGAARRVLLNQGAYLSFRAAPFPPDWDVSPYERPQVERVLVVSDDSLRYLTYAFPKADVHRLHLAIDPELYHPDPKERIVTYMPRKRARDLVQLLGMLHNRGALEGWRIVPIEDLSLSDAARLLRRAAIFLSTTFEGGEGFPLPIAEALASGCAVVGYQGQGGAETLTAERGFPIADGDVVSFAQTVERVARAFDDSDPELAAVTARGSQHIRSTFTAEREQADVVRLLAGLDERPHRADVEIDLASVAPVSPVRHGLALARDGMTEVVSASVARLRSSPSRAGARER